MLNKLLKTIAASGTVIVGIIITGFVLDELGTKARLGSAIQQLAQKVSRGFGQ